mgnify:CR=1 FL=1
MEKYVNIMLDKAFKTVFGEKQVAIDFINATLEGERQVKLLARSNWNRFICRSICSI